jgi:hypothetical protein
MVLLAVFVLAGCAEEEKPIDVPEDVQQGVLAVLKAVDPDVEATFSGETCNTDPLADPPDDHRWRLRARFDGSADEVRAAGMKLGWQPERFEDGTLAIVNYHQFGESVDVVVRDGTAEMLVEKDCSAYEASELNVPGISLPEPTDTQGERLGDLLDEVDDTLADIHRELRVRPKEGVYVEEKGPRTFSGCSAGKRSGARWYGHDLVYAEATRDTELAPTADRLVDAADGWEVVEREEGIDSRGYQAVDLELRSRDGRITLTVGISFWGEVDRPDGVQLHITSGRTECVAVDAE